MLFTISAYADPGDGDGGPYPVIVENWQTFYPRVTSLRSLNAYLATEQGQKIYYVPKLDELPDVMNAVTDCTDYTGTRQRFAAVYGGYFDQMCYEALVRKSDGTYSQVPAIVQTDGKNSVRELTTLGYDFLLSSEGLIGVQPNGEKISATYAATKVDGVNGYVDLNTALMDIYKAVGQSKYDILYAFTPDSTLTVENSPIQKELSLQLDVSRGINTEAGNAWVFVTRTNPSLYWKQAAYDGVIWDSEALHNGDSSGSSNVKSDRVTLAQFCMYAYNIMNIYGEPVMTQSEKNILLQLYGSVVPYKACTEAEVEAIETMIAKGIISPDDDMSKLQWNSDVNFEYMLTLLMRINDVNARKTYKDVQITLDASLLSNDYYNAKLEYEDSNIIEFQEAKSAARVTNYYDAKLGVSQFEDMMKTVSSGNVSSDLFIPTHLVIVGPDNTVFPLTTQVTTYTQKVYDKNSTASYALKNYDVATDGTLMQFCISDGIRTDDTGKFLNIRIASFTVNDLLHSDGMYHLHLINDRGDISTSAFTIKPGGGIYYTSGVRSNSKENQMLTDKEDNSEEEELSNTKEIDELIKLYDEKGVQAATRKLREYERNNPRWTTKEIEAAEYAASNGDYLASTTSTVMYMRIAANSESNIQVITKKGETIKLSNIMANDSGGSETHFADPKATDDLAFRKINSTTYQVDNCNGANDLNERVKSTSVKGTDTAFCKRDTQLLVSTKWLLEKGIISTTPLESDDLLMLSTQYANIYLDKANQYVVVGATVYDVKDLDKSEIWLKTGDDLFVNFRAVLGWTGEYMIFKNVGGSISVSIQESVTTQSKVTAPKSTHIKLLDVPKGISSGIAIKGSSVDIHSYGNDSMISMSAMYPFANYFVYVNSHVLEEGDEYHDWLFVFKPKDVKVNGSKVQYDDTESRKTLRDTLNIKLDGLDENITVWAYPLYRKARPERGMPKGMAYTEKNGYTYLPSKITSVPDTMAAYWATDNVLRSDGTPDFVLPFYLDDNYEVRCFNYNTFTYKDTNGNDDMLDYGQVPATIMDAGVPVDTVYRLNTASGIPSMENVPDISFKDSVMTPTVTSPALWFLELQQYDFNTVCASLNSGAALYWGTSKVTLSGKEGSYKMLIGSTDITDELKKMKFLLMRETAYKTSTIGRWYSVSALSAFKLDPVTEKGEGTKGELGPKAGKLDKTVDSIDWNEFKFTRLLENGEFAVSIATILVVNILPRVALFAFLILTMLGVVQNVKVWQIFCDKLFDPYKFLTAGRRDVHTFQAGRAFVTSIIAMAVYALFMDGTIIHVYEWIMQFIGAFLGS